MRQPELHRSAPRPTYLAAVALALSVAVLGACGGGGKSETAAPCTDGSKRCSGDVPERCDAGQWVAGAACTTSCAAGECTAPCTTGAKRCSGAVPETCDAAGRWVAAAACALGCLNGECEVACTAGTKRCTGSVPQTCGSGGTWQDQATCVDQACVNGDCVGVCAPDARRCSGQVAQLCAANGGWQDDVTCVEQACVAGACVGACAPDAGQCSGQTPRLCDASGHWQDQTACQDQTCVAGVCQGGCAPGATQCSGQVPQTCGAAGQWQDGTSCPFVCQAGACQGVCAPGAKQCSGQLPQTCDAAGQWADGTGCTNQACVNGACLGVCAPGAKQCASWTQPQVCAANGTWANATACASQACVGGDCVGVCTPGARRCVGLAVEQCSNAGAWEAIGGCPYACGSGYCGGECVPGTTRACTGGVCSGTQTCGSNAYWAACSVPSNCECLPGQTQACPQCGTITCSSFRWNSAACYSQTHWYYDDDNDGYGRDGTGGWYCFKPYGSWSTNALDCDDTSAIAALRTPGKPEVCGDGIDNDCSGSCDDGCYHGLYSGSSTDYRDFIITTDANEASTYSFFTAWFIGRTYKGYVPGVTASWQLLRCIHPATGEHYVEADPGNCESLQGSYGYPFLQSVTNGRALVDFSYFCYEDCGQGTLEHITEAGHGCGATVTCPGGRQSPFITWPDWFGMATDACWGQ